MLRNPLRRGVKSLRALWTAATISAAAPHKLEKAAIDRLSQIPQDCHILFTLSKNTPIAAENAILAKIQDSNAEKYAGCLSDTPRASELYTFAYSAFQPEPGSSAFIFRPHIPPSPPPALGREIWDREEPNASTSKDEEEGILQLIQNENKSDWFTNSPSTRRDHFHPSDGSLDQISSPSIKQLFFFSLQHPEELLRRTHLARPDVPKIGLIGASTVFERNGRPQTLFTTNDQTSSDTLALAICANDTNVQNQPSAEILNLKPLGYPMQVLSARGNIINSLSSPLKSATQTLQNLINTNIRKPTIESKNINFFIGIRTSPLPEDYDANHPRALDQEEFDYVTRVLSGSTSRGTVAVATDENINENSIVQFFQQDPDLQYSLPFSTTSGSSTIELITSPPEGGSLTCASSSTPKLSRGEELEILEGIFLSASSYGSFYSRFGQLGRQCPQQGTIVRMSLN